MYCKSRDFQLADKQLFLLFLPSSPISMWNWNKQCKKVSWSLMCSLQVAVAGQPHPKHAFVQQSKCFSKLSANPLHSEVFFWTPVSPGYSSSVLLPFSVSLSLFMLNKTILTAGKMRPKAGNPFTQHHIEMVGKRAEEQQWLHPCHKATLSAPSHLLLRKPRSCRTSMEEALTWFGNKKALDGYEGGNNRQAIRWKAKYLPCAALSQHNLSTQAGSKGPALGWEAKPVRRRSPKSAHFPSPHGVTD